MMTAKTTRKKATTVLLYLQLDKVSKLYSDFPANEFLNSLTSFLNKVHVRLRASKAITDLLWSALAERKHLINKTLCWIVITKRKR
jgi:hypothetical protein